MLKEWKGLWRYRAIVQILIARELKVRYRGTVLGFLWSLLTPLVFMSVYVLVFSLFLRIEMEHYPAFLLCGLLPWMLFTTSVTEASRAIIDNGTLAKKGGFPVEILPLVVIGSNLIHFLLTVPLLVIVFMVLGVKLSWTALLLPGVLLIQLIFTFGIALLCSSLAVLFRDLLHIVPNALLIWFFLTPVLYPANMVPQNYRGFLLFNPMAHLIQAYHQVFFYHEVPSLLPIALLVTAAIAAACVGQFVMGNKRDYLIEAI